MLAWQTLDYGSKDAGGLGFKTPIATLFLDAYIIGIAIADILGILTIHSGNPC